MDTFNSHNADSATLDYDVAIVGAGPIGLELAVCLRRAGVRYVQFDAHQLGYSMTWWPRNTNFFSTTERLAIAGVPIQNNHQQRITGEEYLAYLRGVVELFDLPINSYEPVTAVQRTDEGFTLSTKPLVGERQFRARHVVLAIGDMHYANQIGIPGEDLPHVSHYFGDPHTYFRRRLLVVGGRNSAVETALRCWRAGAQVAVSYRKAQFNDRVKHWLLPDMEAQVEAGTIQFLPETVPVEITPTHVVLEPVHGGAPIIHETDFVLLATGFRGDQSLLEMVGVQLEGENRVPVFNGDTMETNVPGVYLAGTVAAGIQQSYSIFIENAHEHVGKIVAHVTGQWPDKLGDVRARNYELAFEHMAAN